MNTVDPIYSEDFCLVAEAMLKDEPVHNWKNYPCSKYALVSRSQNNIFLKCFLPRSFLERFKSMLRGSRCARSARGSELLLSAGLYAPKNIAQGQVGEVEWLAARAADGAGFGDLLAYLTTYDHPKISLLIQSMLVALGKQIGKMHQQLIVHGDLRPNNIMVSFRNRRTQKKENIIALSSLDYIEPVFTYIDNERTRRYWLRIPNRERRRNLIQIMMIANSAISSKQRSLFFSAYFNCFENKRDSVRLEQKVRDIVDGRLERKGYNRSFALICEDAKKRVIKALELVS